MDITLSDIEARILGSLMEKALSTPDYYPLSLNALTNACNQKTSRDPVVAYDESIVETVAAQMCTKGLVNPSFVGRVPKYEELFSRTLQLVPRETAVLCVLLLRGPQTMGEIRTHTSRLSTFETLEEVQATLSNLEEWGLAHRLARLPGHKESRYSHLLSGEPDNEALETGTQEAAAASPADVRLEKLEHAVAELQDDMESLKLAFQTFRKQFE
jgi:uncharacterized protein YceH (UPF0502 family)